jgi:hypothetical protein
MSKRALRRHHRARLRARRQRTLPWVRGDARRLAQAIDTPVPCSCWMCGNPRRYFNEKTPQERRADIALRESLAQLRRG